MNRTLVLLEMTCSQDVAGFTWNVLSVPVRWFWWLFGSSSTLGVYGQVNTIEGAYNESKGQLSHALTYVFIRRQKRCQGLCFPQQCQHQAGNPSLMYELREGAVPRSFFHMIPHVVSCSLSVSLHALCAKGLALREGGDRCTTVSN